MDIFDDDSLEIEGNEGIEPVKKRGRGRSKKLEGERLSKNIGIRFDDYRYKLAKFQAKKLNISVGELFRKLFDEKFLGGDDY